MRALVLTSGAALLLALVPPLPTAEAVLPVLITTSIADDSYLAAHLSLSGPGNVSISVLLDSAEGPIHTAYGVWITSPLGGDGFGSAFLQIENEQKAYVQADPGVPVEHFVTHVHGARETQVGFPTFSFGLGAGEWLVVVAAASADDTTNVVYTLRGDPTVSVASSTQGDTGFFFLDQDFKGLAHAQASTAWIPFDNFPPSRTPSEPVRAEAGVGLAKTVTAVNELYSVFMVNGAGSGTVNGPGGYSTGGTSYTGDGCVSIVHGAYGDWTFSVDAFAGAWSRFVPVPYPCTGFSSEGALLMDSTEGVFLVGADVTPPV